MSETKHTPGPWSIARSPKGYPYGIRAENGNRGPGGIVDVTRWAAISFPTSPEAEANARLLAAAPDLLEALENLLAEAEDVFNCMADATGINRHAYPQPFVDARAAIARATEA